MTERAILNRPTCLICGHPADDHDADRPSLYMPKYCADCRRCNADEEWAQ